MKKEDLMTPAELNVLLAEIGEDAPQLDEDEPIGAQHLISLQKAVIFLSRQVTELQSQLHEHVELHNKQQEQLLRQMNHQMEHKLYEQIINRMVGGQTPSADEERIEQKDNLEPSSTALTLLSDEHSLPEEQPTYSRVNSYRKIRKRKKGFIERLFD
ncbi:hypothetical protein [Paenibacillus planticolens]|uniref:Uncharacterized protein n=1 Tax=Paenibacillus planticolens TaxID=2654976 RepID=A0ABX1ZNY7_9BACL|nr:hypothetical protein [Paenibacillus planticolens]NOV00330.1 hypothetical protein [Paenibacillus planticolens]